MLGVEFGAHERRDGSWDVYLDDPPGSCPELDDPRNKDGRLLLGNISDLEKFDSFAEQIMMKIGPSYQTDPYYREQSVRRITQQLFDHIRNRGCHGMFLRSDGVHWELWVRRKDWSIAAEKKRSNI